MSSAASHVWRPSSARIVSLDSFVPVPRGTTAVAPAPLSWPAKDPADVLDFQFDISNAVVGNPADSIAALDVAISPDAPGDLVLNLAAIDGTSAILWFAGGQAGTTYVVTLAISTANGRAVTRSVLLPVLALSTPPVPTTALLTNAGSPVVDQNGNPIVLGG